MTRLGIGSRPLGTVAGGLLVALLCWRTAMVAPTPGLDASWNAGLAMAVRDGMHFGTQIVFTYGPLGFLQNQIVWYSDLGLLSFLFLSLQYMALCIGLVWALRRRLPLLVSLVVAVAALTLLVTFLIESNLAIAVLACVWLLEREHSPRALDAFVVATATLGSLAALGKLSTGPLVVLVFLVALIGARVGRWRIAAFVAIVVVELFALWLATGQSLASVPDFVHHTIEISSGYSEAMLRKTTVAPWKLVATVLAAVAISLLLVVVAWFGTYRDRRARWAGMVVIVLASFAIYKEGVVRTDLWHATLFFCNASVLMLAVGLGNARWRLMGAVAAGILLLSLPVRPPGTAPTFRVGHDVELAFEQVPRLFSPGKRHQVSEEGRGFLKAIYNLEPQVLAAIDGRSVSIEPWEVGVAWAYGLDWSPLPVFQSYTAYTSALDRLNTETVEDPDGPERILRENAPIVYPEYPDPDIDGRNLSWDPPEQARAVLCNFAPLFTSERWQVLGRTPDRCGPERELGAVDAGDGEEVPVPAAGPDEVVFVRIDGAGVSGLETLSTTLLRAAVRRLTVNGETSFRIVPGTAADGLLLEAGAAVAEPGPFWQIPEAQTISLEGAPGDLTYRFYAMRVRPATPDHRDFPRAAG